MKKLKSILSLALALVTVFTSIAICFADVEPNNDFGTSEWLTNNGGYTSGRVTSSFGGGSDSRDIYRVYGSGTSKSIRINFTAPSADQYGNKAALSVFDKYGSTLASCPTGNASFTIPANTSAWDHFYIAVSYVGFSAPETYTLSTTQF